MVKHFVNTELMGIFGLAWNEKVASFMADRLSGTSKKKMQDFTQPGGLNVKIVDNLYNYYMASLASGGSPIAFSIAPDKDGNGGDFDVNTLRLADSLQSSTNTDSGIVLNFLRAIWVLARDGKIPYEKWNPVAYEKTTALRKSIPTEQKGGFLQKAESVVTGATNTSKVLMVIAGLGVAGYLLSQLKYFKPGRRGV